MQKISPLRSSIEAFNKFRAARAAKSDKTQKQDGVAQTNPFGITFKGAVIQMDVFEKVNKDSIKDGAVKAAGSIKEKMQNTGKLLASAWVGTINKFSSLKANAIAFGNKIKDNTVAVAKKIRDFGNTEIKFENPFKYTVANLQKQSVGDLKGMLSIELQGVC